MKSILKWKKTIFVAISAAFLTGCEGTTTSVSVGYGVYGGYGYGYGYGYYPPYYRPPYRPGKPDRPDRPERGGLKDERRSVPQTGEGP